MKRASSRSSQGASPRRSAVETCSAPICATRSGFDPAELSRPVQAACISALSFGSFALAPIAGLLVAPDAARIPFVGAVSLLSLVGPGALGDTWAGRRGPARRA